MTFKDIFPGLPRTLSFNFQDFPGPKWFSGTFQVLEFSRKKIQDFPGGVGTLLQPQSPDGVEVGIVEKNKTLCSGLNRSAAVETHVPMSRTRVLKNARDTLSPRRNDSWVFNCFVKCFTYAAQDRDNDITTPLTRIAFVYNGAKGMELALNPHYSGGS